MLGQILAAVASAPVPGRLRPWRFIVFLGRARERLGVVFALGIA
jgi:nitroreductase